MTERRFNPTAARGSHAAKLGKVYLNQPGYYVITLGRGCPEVAARVTHGPTPDPGDPGNPMDRSWFWTVFVNDELHKTAPDGQEPDWLIVGRPISKAEHDYMVARHKWARQCAPHLPEANPRKPIDLRTLDVSTLFPERQDAR